MKVLIKLNEIRGMAASILTEPEKANGYAG
jgi:hypothetical protein